MMKLPIKVNQRDKRVLLIGGLIALLIIAFSLFSWYRDFVESVSGVSDAKIVLLKKQLIKLSERDDLQMQVNAFKEDFKRRKSSLLKGEKTPVAGAELQRILKEMASSLNIDVNLQRELTPVDFNFYLGIPVEIGFTANTDKLSGMLYMLKQSPFLLKVTEMKIRVTNVNNPVNVNATLQIMGFIEKLSAEKTAGAEEGKDVS
jgi:Tfp pilus assembly protein PilN